jgi:ATP-dependent DNA helicase RecG
MPKPETREEILERIRLGEDSSFEMKSVQFAGERVSGLRRDGLADELAGFANGSGGVCILGVDDVTREITEIPLDKLDAAEGYVREIANDSIEPPLLVHIERLILPGVGGQDQAVLKLSIEPSLFVHQSPGGYFHRIGSSKRKMSPEYLARLFQQRSQSRIIRFDEQIVADTSVGDLEQARWQRLTTDRTLDDEVTFLQKLGMARADAAGEVRPTVAGVLMASADPRRWLPNAFIQAVAYQGDAITPDANRPYQLDALDCIGPLDQQVVDGCRFVFRNMKTAAFKHLGRRDVPQYDMEAVFEALVNAVAHRDYSIHGSKIRLRVFSDRLEIYSPGALANTMGIEGLEYRQAARNETITSLLAKCPIRDLDWLKTSRSTMMDRRGEGVRIILEHSERLSGRRPEYRLVDDSELILTIWAASPEARESAEGAT